MKAIIKNKEKYKLVPLKPALGLNLEEFDTQKRTGVKGISTSRFGSRWFITPKGRGIFKNYNIDMDGTRIANELLYDELAKQLGISVAKYKPAHYKKYNGLLSMDIAKSNEELMDGCGLLDYDEFGGFNVFVDYIKALDIFKEGEGYYVDKSNIKMNLYKMMILDSLTFQEDRHEHNMTFLVNHKDGYLTCAPLIDNEMCFAALTLNSDEANKFKYIDYNTFMKLHGEAIRLHVNTVVSKLPCEQRYKANIKELVRLATKSKRMQNFLFLALHKLNIEEAFQNVEKLGYEISPEYKNYVKNLIKISKNTFKECISEIRQECQDSIVLEDKIYDK